MSEHKWKTGDRAMYDSVYDYYQCTVIGWDEDRYVVRFDDKRLGSYGDGFGFLTDEHLRPIPRTVEQITQEAVEDYEDTSALSSARKDCTRYDFLNALGAIIEAAIYADREERAQ